MSNEYSPLLGNEQQALSPETTPRNNKIGWMDSLNNTLKNSYLNILLIFIPIGIIVGKMEFSETTIFICNFISIVPLAKLLGFATEELSLRTSETIGGLLNATFGNAVELIVGIIALKNGFIDVVQASMVGSLLSNLLLVLGMCFFFGGMRYKVQSFSITASNTSASLLTMTVFMIILPVAFNYDFKDKEDIKEKEVMFSRYTSVVMLVLYISYLFFQLKTHSEFFKSNPSLNSLVIRENTTENPENEAERRIEEGRQVEEEEEENEEPTISLSFSVLLLLIVTLLISVCADYLVDSIDGISEKWNLSKTFVGLILLPIVGNAAEHVTAITVAMKNKMDLAIGVALGSSMQIALMVTPFLVIVGWIVNIDMSLVFSLFETVVVFASAFVVNQLINDGKSNWLEGAMLLGAYVIIAVAYWYA